MKPDMPRPSWRIRRRVIVATLLFCAGEIIFLTGWGKDTDLASTIANGVLILAGSVIGAYVFGAAWDDRNVMTAMRRGGRRRDRDDDLAPNGEE
jgi:hypothetical protein